MILLQEDQKSFFQNTRVSTMNGEDEKVQPISLEELLAKRKRDHEESLRVFFLKKATCFYYSIYIYIFSAHLHLKVRTCQVN